MHRVSSLRSSQLVWLQKGKRILETRLSVEWNLGWAYVSLQVFNLGHGQQRQSFGGSRREGVKEHFSTWLPVQVDLGPSQNVGLVLYITFVVQVIFLCFLVKGLQSPPGWKTRQKLLIESDNGSSDGSLQSTSNSQLLPLDRHIFSQLFHR